MTKSAKLFSSVILSIVMMGVCFGQVSKDKKPVNSQSWLNKEMKMISAQSPDLSKRILRLSLIAYRKARTEGLDDKGLLTIIDFSKPSSEKRLWVFDLNHNRKLYYTWVTHGYNSGGLRATSFSNKPGSLKTSIGLYVTTDEAYFGNNGYSLRLRGLEQGFNSNAYDRDIVMHGAWYADGNVVAKYGQLGRSFGCPAVKTELAKPLINTIKDNTLIFAYYPDKNWLAHSKFLNV